MIFVKLTKTFNVTGVESVDELDQHTDAVMDELLALECDDVTDADISAELVRGVVEVSIVAGADNFDAALERADACIRSAIHAAGGHTPVWSPILVQAGELATT